MPYECQILMKKRWQRIWFLVGSVFHNILWNQRAWPQLRYVDSYRYMETNSSSLMELVLTCTLFLCCDGTLEVLNIFVHKSVFNLLSRRTVGISCCTRFFFAVPKTHIPSSSIPCQYKCTQECQWITWFGRSRTGYAPHITPVTPSTA